MLKWLKSPENGQRIDFIDWFYTHKGIIDEFLMLIHPKGSNILSMAKARKKFSSLEEAKAYVASLPMNTIIDELAEYYCDSDDLAPVRITQAQFNRFFKVIGVMDNGSKETRGRKRKMPQFSSFEGSDE